MIEKRISVANDHQEAMRISREQDNLLGWEERFAAFMKLMEPYYASAKGLQRICRIDDLRERQVRDDWGLRIQPLSEPESDG